MSATTSGVATPRPQPQQEEEEKEEETLIPSLLNDISINILARIPRSHHPILSLVSKPFRSLLSSPHYYATRTALPSSEPTLYLCLRLPTPAASALRWFALHHNSPNPKNPPHFLVHLPPTPLPLLGSAFVSVGPKVYVIGGSINDLPSSRVLALDCRFNTWESVPGMRIPREFATAGVVDGLVYVFGGCLVNTWARSKNWAEVFDPVAMRWDAVNSEVEGLMREKWMHASAVINGRIYAMADRNGVVYEPRMKRWGSVEKRLDLGWRGRACVVDEVLYCYDYVGKIQGFDVRIGAWRELRGLGKELPKFLCGATMANVGGKLVVVWEGKEGSGKEMEIWCAEIEVEKKGEGELLGKIVWCDVVHKVPRGSAIFQCLAVTL